MEITIKILEDEDMQVQSICSDEFLKLKEITEENSKNNKEK